MALQSRLFWGYDTRTKLFLHFGPYIHFCPIIHISQIIYISPIIHISPIILISPIVHISSIIYIGSLICFNLKLYTFQNCTLVEVVHLSKL